MNLNDLVKEFGLDVKTGSGQLDREVTGGYVSDLLSDVLAHGEEGNVWVTLHIHQNIVAWHRTRTWRASFWSREGSRKRTRSPRPRKRTFRYW